MLSWSLDTATLNSGSVSKSRPILPHWFEDESQVESVVVVGKLLHLS